MTQIAKKQGFTIMELVVVTGLLMLLLGFAWQFYFGGRETMRHTVSQSQVQADTRIFLDKLETQMASCYAFNEIDPDTRKFSFYAFTFGKVSLDDVFYDTTGKPRPYKSTDNTNDSRVKVVKYEYVWKDNIVTQYRTPGWLMFLRKPMEFREDTDPAHFNNEFKKLEKVVLRNMVDFDVQGYKQTPNPDKKSFTTEKLTKDKAAEASFIVLRLHTMKDESANRRDEELDIVTKFYSQVKLAEIANPDFFCSTDAQGHY